MPRRACHPAPSSSPPKKAGPFLLDGLVQHVHGAQMQGHRIVLVSERRLPELPGVKIVPPKGRGHSCLNASEGSTLAALRAGIQAAPAPVVSRRIATAENMNRIPWGYAIGENVSQGSN